MQKECEMSKYNIRCSEATLKKNLWDYFIGLADSQLEEFISVCKAECSELYDFAFPLITEYYLVKGTNEINAPSTETVGLEPIMETDNSLVTNTTFAQALTALINLQKAFLAHIKGEL